MCRAIVFLACILGGSAFAQAPEPVNWLGPPGPPLFGLNPLNDVFPVDLDGDGDLDLVFATSTLGGAIYVQLNGWQGAVREQVRLHAIADPRRVVAVDLDLDGVLDLVVVAGRQLHLLRRQGPALSDWERTPLLAAEPYDDNRLRVIDLDGDGHPDLSVENEARDVLLARAGGPLARRLTADTYTTPTYFADFEGDGDLDGLAMGPEGFRLLRNDGALPWVEVPLALEGRPYGFANVRPASPGAEALGRTADGHLRVAPNRAASGGTFAAWQSGVAPALYDSVALDVDGDGDLDLLGIAADQEATAVLLEATPPSWTPILVPFVPNPRPQAWRGVAIAADLRDDGSDDLVVGYTGFGDPPGPYGYFHAYAIGRGVVSSRTDAAGDLTVEGGDALNALTVTTTRIAPYDGALRVTGVELLLLVDGDEAAPVPAVVDHVDIFAEATGDSALGVGDVLVARVDAPETVSAVALDHPALAFRGDEVSRLYVQVQLTPGAHLHGTTLRIGWLSTAATSADGPIPTALDLGTSGVWTLRNQPPVAVEDQVSVPEGEARRLDLLANDLDPRGDPLRVVIVDGPEHGVVEVDEDGVATYTHDGSETVMDAFTYQAVDPGGLRSEVVAVEVLIEPVNDPPVGAEDAYVTDEDTPLVVEPDLGVLFNDTDAEGDLLTAVLEVPPEHGELALRPDGGFVYLPDLDFAGQDRFVYRPDDGQDTGAPVTVIIEVLATDDPPRPALDGLRTGTDTPVRLELAALDPDGGVRWLLLESFPDHGHLVDLDPPAAAVTYVPPRGFTGVARFDFRLSDGRDVSPVYEAVVAVGP